MPSTQTTKKTSKKKPAAKPTKDNGAANKPSPSTSSPRPRPVPVEFPGMERERDPELERMGSLLYRRGSELSTIREEVGQIKDDIIRRMDDKHLASYKMDDGQIIKIFPSERVRILKPSDDDE